MKTCFKCLIEKPLTDYYKHPQMLDGHQGKCKDCAKKDVRENRLRKLDYYRELSKSNYKNNKERYLRKSKEYVQKYPEKKALYVKKYRAKFPDKYKAHCLVNNSVRDNRLIKQPCEKCGETLKVHAHHDDYSKPLEVRWLCESHHKEWHNKNQEVLST